MRGAARTLGVLVACVLLFWVWSFHAFVVILNVFGVPGPIRDEVGIQTYKQIPKLSRAGLDLEAVFRKLSSSESHDRC